MKKTKRFSVACLSIVVLGILFMLAGCGSGGNDGGGTDNDKDSDGIVNTSDNCPDVSNADQADLDGDGMGDVCDNSGPKVIIKASDNPYSSSNNLYTMEISGCSWSKADDIRSNIDRNLFDLLMSFNWSLTPLDGNCIGETYSVFVHYITYSNITLMSAKYDYNGSTYSVQMTDYPNIIDISNSYPISWNSAEHYYGSSNHYLTITELHGPKDASINNIIPGLYSAKGTYDITNSSYSTGKIDLRFLGECTTRLNDQHIEERDFIIPEGQLSGTFEVVQGCIEMTGGKNPRIQFVVGNTMHDAITLY